MPDSLRTHVEVIAECRKEWLDLLNAELADEIDIHRRSNRPMDGARHASTDIMANPESLKRYRDRLQGGEKVGSVAHMARSGSQRRTSAARSAP